MLKHDRQILYSQRPLHPRRGRGPTSAEPEVADEVRVPSPGRPRVFTMLDAHPVKGTALAAWRRRRGDGGYRLPGLLRRIKTSLSKDDIRSSCAGSSATGGRGPGRVQGRPGDTSPAARGGGRSGPGRTQACALQGLDKFKDEKKPVRVFRRLWAPLAFLCGPWSSAMPSRRRRKRLRPGALRGQPHGGARADPGGGLAGRCSGRRDGSDPEPGLRRDETILLAGSARSRWWRRRTE